MKGLDAGKIKIDEQSRLIWIRVNDAMGMLWEENPKLHDIGGVIESLQRYGLQDKPRYDETLGAIKHGNGRIEALAMMEVDGGYEPPRGIAIEKETGNWCMQIEVGVDAESIQEARAYAIDTNNLTLSGSSLGIVEMMRMWDSAVTNIVMDLSDDGHAPISVDCDDYTALLEDSPDYSGLIEKFESPEKGKVKGNERWFYVEFHEAEGQWERVLELLAPHLRGTNELEGSFFFKMVGSYLGEVRT